MSDTTDHTLATIASSLKEIDERHRVNSAMIIRIDERLQNVHSDIVEFKERVKNDIDSVKNSIKAQEMEIVELRKFNTEKNAEIGVWRWVIGFLGIGFLVQLFGFDIGKQ